MKTKTRPKKLIVGLIALGLALGGFAFSAFARVNRTVVPPVELKGRTLTPETPSVPESSSTEDEGALRVTVPPAPAGDEEDRDEPAEPAEPADEP